MHGFGVLLRIEQITHGALLAEQGALYPALHRLERAGGVIAQAAAELGFSRQALYRRMERLGIART